jgi:hypothetical protein
VTKNFKRKNGNGAPDHLLHGLWILALLVKGHQVHGKGDLAVLRPFHRPKLSIAQNKKFAIRKGDDTEFSVNDPPFQLYYSLKKKSANMIATIICLISFCQLKKT